MPGIGGRKEEELLIKGHKVSVKQDELSSRDFYTALDLESTILDCNPKTC